MRQRRYLSAGAAAGAAALVMVAAPVLAFLPQAQAAPAAVVAPDAVPRPLPRPLPLAVEPYCGDRDSPDFPLRARIRGGPREYAAGGGWRRWSIGLRNTTDRACRGVHPVAVLVDSTRELAAERIHFQFYDAYSRSWRPVTLETTDRHEHIAVFDGFPGFAVPAGGTVTVGVRLRFAEGTPRNAVRLTVAAVQRRDDDGDWVGSSNDYAFTIRGGGRGGAGTGTAEDTRPRGDAERDRDRDRERDRGQEPGRDRPGGGAEPPGTGGDGRHRPGRPEEADGPGGPGERGGTRQGERDGHGRPGRPGRPGISGGPGGPVPPGELARTGTGGDTRAGTRGAMAARLGGAAGAAIALGAVLVAASRRVRC